MMMSRKEMKCLMSLSSFVNRSEIFIFPAICCTDIVLFKMDSRMAFSRIWMCLSPLVVMLEDQRTHALLSLYMVVSFGQKIGKRSKSDRMCLMCNIFLVHSSVA